MIAATRDPDGANLDRIQIVKGWLGTDGELEEKIYDVALSEGRGNENGGQVEPVGNSVDLQNATYSNDIGDTQLSIRFHGKENIL